MSMKRPFVKKMEEVFDNFLLRLYGWGLRWTVKRVVKAQILILSSATIRARMRFGLPLVYDDENLDRDLYEAAHCFFNEGLETQKRNADELSKRGGKIYKWLKDDSTAKTDVRVYLEVEHFFATTVDDLDKAEKIYSLYKATHQTELTPLDFSGLEKHISSLRKRVRADAREFRNSKAQLLKIKLSHLAAMLSLAPAVLSVSGYIHVSILFGHFGVDASKFFLLGDYLAASVNHIKYTVPAMLSFALGALHGYRGLPMLTNPDIERDRRRGKIQGIVLWVTAIGGGATMHVLSVPVQPMFVALWVIVLTNTVASYLAHRYFKNPFSAYSSIMFATIFFALLYAQTKQEIARIEAGETNGQFQVYAVNQKFTDENYIFLGGSGRYIFLLGRDGQAEIIPRQKINHISMSNRK